MCNLQLLTPFINVDGKIVQSFTESTLIEFSKQPPIHGFDFFVMEFIRSLSKELLTNQTYRDYPELVALGFWLREANLKKKIQESDLNTNGETYTGLGCVTHFTPSNVDTMFVYSWIASLMMGNCNIVRLASKDSRSKRVLLNVLNTLLSKPDYVSLAKRNIFVHYEKQTHWTDILSSVSDARLIWGGDASVASIQRAQAKPNCIDFCFSDKVSVAILDAELLGLELENAATRLWQDTQPYFQQACSSPRILYLLGDEATARPSLVKLIEQINELAYQNSDNWQDKTRLNEHLNILQAMAAEDLLDDRCSPICLPNVTALDVLSLNHSLLDLHKGNGLFFVKKAARLNELFESLSKEVSSKLQTISVLSNDQDDIEQSAHQYLKPINYRIVPLGNALEFNFVWDGYNLLKQLSN